MTYIYSKLLSVFDTFKDIMVKEIKRSNKYRIRFRYNVCNIEKGKVLSRRS